MPTGRESIRRSSEVGQATALQAGRCASPGPGWLHEIKFDGYRIHARLDRSRVQLLFGPRQDGQVPADNRGYIYSAGKTGVPGWELCAVRPDGKTSFDRNRLLVRRNGRDAW
jgi:hypothetical protein